MVRIVAAILAEDMEEHIGLCLQSILKWIDKVYIIYSPSKDDTLQEILQFNDERIEIIVSPYDHQDKAGNPKQRNKYLKAVKNNEDDGTWVLVLDADEILSDEAFRIKDFLRLDHSGCDCYNPKMRHLVRTLGWEDATKEKHNVPCRLFQINGENRRDLIYPEQGLHSVLTGYNNHGGDLDFDWFTIWHISAFYDVFEIHKRYHDNLKKSNIHNPELLRWWYTNNVTGTYPMKQLDPNELPVVLKRRFEL